MEHNKPNWDKLQAISVLTSDSPLLLNLGPALNKNPYIYMCGCGCGCARALVCVSMWRVSVCVCVCGGGGGVLGHYIHTSWGNSINFMLLKPH